MGERPPEPKSLNLQGDRVPIHVCLLLLAGAVFATGIIAVVVRHYGIYGGLRAGFRAEFLSRPDGYQGMSRHYGFRFYPEPEQLKSRAVYKMLADGSVDVIRGLSTDGSISKYNFIALEDDKNFFPPRRAAPLVRSETLRKYPEIAEILNRLGGMISNETMRNLNYKAGEKGRTVTEVARQFMASRGLIGPGKRTGGGLAGSVIVGSKQSTEQEVLGEIMAIMIERNSDIKVVRRLSLGDTMTCFNALRSGEIDLYPEYTGNGLLDILERQAIPSGLDESYRMVKRVFDKEYDLIWLEPFGSNSNYALIMRWDEADRLGILTISDLARYIERRRGGVPPLVGQF